MWSSSSPLRRWLFLLAVAVVTAAVVVGTSAAGVRHIAVPLAASDATSVYPDTPGDSKSAPDVAATAVGYDGSRFTFVVGLASMPDLAPDAQMLVGIDADRNASTGDSLGAEYVVYAEATGAVLAKWDGSTYVAYGSGIRPTKTGAGIAFSIAQSDIGVSTFDFFVATLRGSDLDVAPDNGRYTFPRPVVISKLLIPATSLFPRAGKVFRFSGIQLMLDTGETVSPESTDCTLTYRGKTLTPLSGGCAWRIPKTAKKKKVILHVTLTYQGAQVEQTMPLKVS